MWCDLERVYSRLFGYAYEGIGHVVCALDSDAYSVWCFFYRNRAIKQIPVLESCNPIDFSCTVDKATVQPPSGVMQSRITSNGMIPHTRFSHSNLQMLPTMIKRMPKPIRAMAWGVKKLNIDRRFSMKVRVIVFGGGTVPTRGTKTGFCCYHPLNMGRACASSVSLTSRVWIVCERAHAFFRSVRCNRQCFHGDRTVRKVHSAKHPYHPSSSEVRCLLVSVRVLSRSIPHENRLLETSKALTAIQYAWGADERLSLTPSMGT